MGTGLFGILSFPLGNGHSLLSSGTTEYLECVYHIAGMPQQQYRPQGKCDSPVANNLPSPERAEASYRRTGYIKKTVVDSIYQRDSHVKTCGYGDFFWMRRTFIEKEKVSVFEVWKNGTGFSEIANIPGSKQEPSLLC